MTETKISDRYIQEFYEQLKREGESSGYHLNPDIQFTQDLVNGLLINKKRYGYQACPCRLAKGVKEEDSDIICPCDYRDDDLNEYGSCYCALYVSEDIVICKKNLNSIPERRLPIESRKRKIEPLIKQVIVLQLPVWRCKVCGYLCARESPPEVCPICKVKKDRFERFI